MLKINNGSPPYVGGRRDTFREAKNGQELKS